MSGLTVADWIAVVLITVTLLKAGEMAYHKRLVDREVSDAWQQLPFTRLIGRVPLLHWAVFRLPTQIVGLSVIGFLVQHTIIAWTVAFVIVAILWFLIGRMMYDLLRQGTNRHLSSLGAPNFLTSSKPELGPRERIRSFVITLIAFVSLIVLGYSSTFYICHTQFCRTAFTGIPEDGFEFFYFLYYSLVTFGTVGYGDVYPKGDSPLVRIVSRSLVGSEICLSFIVVAVFIASFSIAFADDANSRANKRG